MFAFIRNLRSKLAQRLREQLLLDEVDRLMEERESAAWWQTVLDMQVLRDEAAELEEDVLEAQFAEDWAAHHDAKMKQLSVAVAMHNLFPAYEIASEELIRRDFALPA